MALFDNLLTSMGPIFQGIQTINEADGAIDQMRYGSQLQVAGANYQAAQYRSAGQATYAQAQYNERLEKLQLDRNLNKLSKDIGQFIGTQRVQMAASGLSGSKSFLMVANDTMDQFERHALDLRNTSAQRRQSILFEGAVNQAALENQARAAQYQAQVNQAMMNARIASAESKQGNMFGTLLNGFTKVFTGLGN